MSKKSEAFIDKYVVGKDDWLLKHKEVIAKLLDEYETEQLTIPDAVEQSEQLPCKHPEDRIWYNAKNQMQCNECGEEL